MLAGCADWIETEVVDELEACSTIAGAALCVFELESTGDESYDSTFWRSIDGTIELVRVGGEACSLHGSQYPTGWSECGAGPNDPPECACMCTAGECPGDVALTLLEACGLPEPCDEIDPEGDVGWQAGEDCFYAALASTTAGVLRVHQNFGDPDWEDHVYVRGDGTANWLHGECDLVCVGSCDDRDWGLPRTCTLRQPDYFDACAATQDAQLLEACRDPAQWFESCTIADASCP